MTAGLAERFDRVLALDVSPAMLEQARKAIPDEHVEFRAISGERLDGVEDAIADVVVCYLVLQHLPSREVVLSYVSEFARVLKPGGEAFVQVPVLEDGLRPRVWRAYALGTRSADALPRADAAAGVPRLPPAAQRARRGRRAHGCASLRRTSARRAVPLQPRSVPAAHAVTALALVLYGSHFCRRGTRSLAPSRCRVLPLPLRARRPQRRDGRAVRRWDPRARAHRDPGLEGRAPARRARARGTDALRARRPPVHARAAGRARARVRAARRRLRADPAGRARRTRDAQGDRVRAAPRPDRRRRVLPRPRRVVRVRDVRWLVLGLAAAVSVWGLVDVYVIHLDWWRHNGTVGYFHDQLGFDYGKGLSGLPENFVYNTGNEQDLLRRLVSTFLSPLGTAYLCVVALLLAPRTRVAIPFAALAAAGLLWTHTRAALLALAVGFVVLAAVSRRAWPLAAAVATLAIGFAFVKAFPHIGPNATFTPAELKVQRANAQADQPARRDSARAVRAVASGQPSRGNPHRRPPPAGLRPRQRGRGRVPRRDRRRRWASPTTRRSAPRRACSARSSSSRGTSRSRSGSRSRAAPSSRPCSSRCSSSRFRPTRTGYPGLRTASGGLQDQD